MSRLLMQPKIYNLRLNLEQVSHVTDGLVENRKNITDRHIELYDSQMNDIFDQFAYQDVHIEVDLDEEASASEDAEKAADLMKALEEGLMEVTMDSRERFLILHDVYELKKVLFGEGQK